MKLRDYQQNQINQARQAFVSGFRAPLLVLPCGGGKTVEFSEFTRLSVAKQNQVLILAHREELVDQISDALKRSEVKHSFIAPSKPYDIFTPVHVASVFSAVRRLYRMQKPDLIIIDEAHHVTLDSTWGRVLDAFPGGARLGVTATPCRLSGEPLSDIFDTMIEGPDVPALIALGALVPARTFVPSSIDTSQLPLRFGDFQKSDLAKLTDKPAMTGCAIAEYSKRAHGKRAVVFCISIDHAKHVAQAFREAGFRAVCLDGTMQRSERREIVENFRAGVIQVVTSVDVVSEGFDLPAIEVAIILRKTASLAWWIQACGRAMRPYDGKTHAIILDHVGNTLIHGLPDAPRKWSLTVPIKPKRDGVAALPVRTCGKCQAALPVTAKACEYCGWVFPIEPRTLEVIEGDLIETNPEMIKAAREAIKKQRRVEVGKARTAEALLKIAQERGYSEGWVRNVLRARGQRF